MKSISQITDIIIFAIEVQYLEVNLYIGNCLNLMDGASQNDVLWDS